MHTQSDITHTHIHISYHSHSHLRSSDILSEKERSTILFDIHLSFLLVEIIFHTLLQKKEN